MKLLFHADRLTDGRTERQTDKNTEETWRH